MGPQIMIGIVVALVTVSLQVGTIVCDVSSQIPEDKSQVNTWFASAVKPFTERKADLDPNLVTAEEGVKVITVGAGGDFATIAAAIESISSGNTNRIIVWIKSGVYKEKIKIERTKPFVTLYGDPTNLPTVTYGGTAQKFGTFDSATVIVESDYFTAVNVIFENSSPKPDGKTDAQAVALRISGDRASFYKCRFVGYQDTLCDDKGLHFFMGCQIRGTVDFIFGSGTSLYLSNELFIEGGFGFTVITAPASDSADNGFAFVHSKILGNSNGTYLGRAWKANPKVIYAFTEMGSVISAAGWGDSYNPSLDKTVYYGEYECTGPGSNMDSRKSYAKQLTSEEAKPYLSLAYIQGSEWLLPPPIPKV